MGYGLLAPMLNGFGGLFQLDTAIQNDDTETPNLSYFIFLMTRVVHIIYNRKDALGR